jgi:hypothetical protein
MMKNVVVFIFHKDWDVCGNHLALLRAFNPSIRIYGLFGGEELDATAARDALASHFEEMYVIPNSDALWKKKHTDLSVRAWYQDFGCNIDFDVLHVLQWDILFFAPLCDAYRNIPTDALGLTGITLISKIASRWHWALFEPDRSNLVKLEEFAKTRHGYEAPLEACLGPGYCLPRAFLEMYAAHDIPEIGHDEIRLPLFARIWGFPIVDTGFYPRWFDPEEEQFFNADSHEIEDTVIFRELSLSGGRRVFHPYRSSFCMT